MLDTSLDDGASTALAALPDRLRDALAGKMITLGSALQARIAEKLSGGVLGEKTGALARSITVALDDAAADPAVSLGVTGDIKYAAIHEFGGVIPPHEIVPDKAKALAFIVGGKQVFAARVNLPAVVMPERSYMRSSLADMADEIKEELSAAAGEAIG